MKKTLLLSVTLGATLAFSAFPSAALATPAPTESESVAIEALDRHGLRAETAPAGATQIDANGSATVGGITVQPDSMGRAAEVTKPGLVVIDGARSADTVVQSVSDGVRFLSVIKDAQAPTEYEYRFPSASLTKNDDGSVTVKARDGSVVGIQPAWALDANGASVPTEYEVRGDTLLQKVSHAGFAYPVVADPRISNCLVRSFLPGQCIKWNRADTERFYRNIATAAGITAAAGTVCGSIPHAAIKAGCTAIFAAKFSDYTSSVTEAHNSSKCLEMRIALISLVATDFRVANC